MPKTWEELSKADNDIRLAVESIRKDLGPKVMAAFGFSQDPFANAQEVTFSPALFALLWKQVQELRTEMAPESDAEESWNDLGTTTADGTIMHTYLSNQGNLANVPERFLCSFVAGRTVDAMVAQGSDPRSLELRRGAKVIARIPKSLLRHFVALREKGRAKP